MGKQNRTMAESNYISMAKTDTWKARTARVVIVGGGFGGLAAAKALRRAPVKVILIDRTNHHVFQPLLYQVATSVLVPLSGRVLHRVFQKAFRRRRRQEPPPLKIRLEPDERPFR